MKLTHEYSLSLNNWHDKDYAGSVQHLAWQNFVRTNQLLVVQTDRD